MICCKLRSNVCKDMWTNMCVEQGLMRPMKSAGGLTHGRGITESTVSTWVLGTPFFLTVHKAVEDILGVAFQYE
ncbi:hypothetical protein J6590_029372 [Homalodisca vitripennis]|nr:hypothetical protein J6590_029372 [Homalodisca vitripennis]